MFSKTVTHALVKAYGLIFHLIQQFSLPLKCLPENIRFDVACQISNLNLKLTCSN